MDQVTIIGIDISKRSFQLQSYGVDRWLGELARDLKDGT